MKKILDSVIAGVSPERGLVRARARAALQAVNQGAATIFGGQGGNGQGYGSHGASRRKKGLLGWFTGTGSPDKDIVDNQPTLVERSRDLFMGAPLATGAIKTIRTNAVGSGLRLHAAIDAKFLGLTPAQAEDWHSTTEREFRLWADSPDCDAYRRMNFGQLQSLAMLTALVDGDAFAALPIKPRKGCPYDLRIKLLDGALVCTPDDGSLDPSLDVRGGIEQDADGEALAAWVASAYPDKLTQRTWTRVQFRGTKSGAPQLLHIAQDWERIGQRRAVPLLAPVIETLKQLSRLTEAELTAFTVNSFFTVFVKSQTPSAPLQTQYDGSGSDNQPVAAADPNAYEMGSGSVVGLADNEDITVANAARSNSSFEPFVKAICQQIGAGIELPYELLMKHFTASYSASRAALLEAWKMFLMRRSWLVDGFVQPTYEQWLAEAVAKGRIVAPGFFADPAVHAAWCGAHWVGPGQGHLNPLAEAKAAALCVEEEFTTRKQVAQEFSGMAWEDIHPVRTREEAVRRADQTIKNAGDFGTTVAAATPAILPAPDNTDGEAEA